MWPIIQPSSDIFTLKRNSDPEYQLTLGFWHGTRYNSADCRANRTHFAFYFCVSNAVQELFGRLPDFDIPGAHVLEPRRDLPHAYECRVYCRCNIVSFPSDYNG